MLRFIGILIVLGSLILPIAAVDIDGFEAIPAWTAYFSSLIGGFLVGFGGPVSAGESAGGTDEPGCSNPDCGKPVPPGQLFCTACGTPVQEPKDMTIRCSNPACGAVVSAGQRFCMTCGTRLQ